MVKIKKFKKQFSILAIEKGLHDAIQQLLPQPPK